MTGGLRIENLEFSYRSVSVLNNIHLEIPAGELCAVVGQSGAGKSTLIKCLVQVERPTRGTVDYAGTSVSFDAISSGARSADLSIIKQLGYVPQSTLLFPHMTALKNVMLPLTEAHSHAKDCASARALEAMDAIGIADLAGHYPWRLSGGQQQRVAIARALASRPQVFLMDEPTAAIDTRNSELIAQVLRNDVRSRNVCGLVVTHNLAFAKRHCDSIALLSDGRIHWHLRTDEVRVEQALMELG